METRLAQVQNYCKYIKEQAKDQANPLSMIVDNQKRKTHM